MPLTPIAQGMLDALTANPIDWKAITPQQFRAISAQMERPAEEGDRVSVRHADADGVPVRIYRREEAVGDEPVLVFYHGGGYIACSVKSHERLCVRLARLSECTVVSVDYRLAPEFPYPAPLDDCLAVIAALPDAAAGLGVSADRYAVIGDSAGGNLAAAVALALKGKANAPAGQVLVYTVTDMLFDNASYRATPDEGGILTTGMMRFFWDAYVGQSEPDGLAAPLRAADVSGAAPATVILAVNDPLHDEGFAYAVKLHEAGVPTDLHDFSGGVHGFASFFGIAPVADQAIALAVAGLKRALS